MTRNGCKNKKNIFSVKDCAIITQTAGLDCAINLRELKERIIACPIECLYFHFCETLVRPTFDNPEFRNDFALWSSIFLRDRVLAERLGIINPYMYGDFEQLREKLLEVVDERLSELQHIPSVGMGEEFFFMRAATVVFDTGIELSKPQDLKKSIKSLSNSSLYYHFLEARRRTTDGVDDFTFWLQFLKKKPQRLIDALAQIDFYFLNLSELKEIIVKTVTTSL